MSLNSKSMYYLYIIECADKTLYTGITKDLERRIFEHNETKRGAKYTSSRRPIRLVFFQKFEKRYLAMREEYRIKQLRKAQKVELIEEFRKISR
jgi:putative endonuclease